MHTKILCFIDGDATYDPRDLKKVVKLVRKGADMALGNRLARIDKRAMTKYIEVGNKILTISANLLYGIHISDSQTGLRAIKTSVFKKLGLKEEYFGIEEEMNIKATKMGFMIKETPINYYVREGSSKQFKPIDGVKLLLTNFKFLWND